MEELEYFAAPNLTKNVYSRAEEIRSQEMLSVDDMVNLVVCASNHCSEAAQGEASVANHNVAENQAYYTKPVMYLSYMLYLVYCYNSITIKKSSNRSVLF